MALAFCRRPPPVALFTVLCCRFLSSAASRVRDPPLLNNYFRLLKEQTPFEPKIIHLIHEEDNIEKAALCARQAATKYCRLPISTINEVLEELLEQSKHAELLDLYLYRFFTQEAGIVPNVKTHDLIVHAYLNDGKLDTALEYYKKHIGKEQLFLEKQTFLSYRRLVKELVEIGKLDKAMELKEEMGSQGFPLDPIAHMHLMKGYALFNRDLGGAIKVYDELIEAENGASIPHYSVRRWSCYIGDHNPIPKSAIAYNSLLEGLSYYGQFKEALELFEKMKLEKNVNLASFNLIINSYCAERKFMDALQVFRGMGNYSITPDTRSYNNFDSKVVQKIYVG
ncbi:pentatricopeptide repeat-containing protein At3g49240, mitochondrial-like [Rutidosis leptorrhynchoides]|uniref:pentatricopeptide repeat-containing protein At3g49240, mitochondrial-like n=1 Tax=Rutidosis leptorrhynchoides TaxID=125765 RepID=UPI003A99178E